MSKKKNRIKKDTLNAYFNASTGSFVGLLAVCTIGGGIIGYNISELREMIDFWQGAIAGSAISVIPTFIASRFIGKAYASHVEELNSSI